MTLQKTAHYVEILCLAEQRPQQMEKPEVFIIYKNDQLLHNGIRNFVYADDLCVTAQYTSFTEVEHTIEEALDELTTYYRSNSLRAKDPSYVVPPEESRGKDDVRSQME